MGILNIQTSQAIQAENISRERRLGDTMKQAEKVAYKEAENG